ncbi:hypothetical protein D3C86_1465440 [compost metagenome]
MAGARGAEICDGREGTEGAVGIDGGAFNAAQVAAVVAPHDVEKATRRHGCMVGALGEDVAGRAEGSDGSAREDRGAIDVGVAVFRGILAADDENVAPDEEAVVTLPGDREGDVGDRRESAERAPCRDGGAFD